MSKINLKKATRDEFKESLLEGNRGYLKKLKSWKKHHIWWDDLNDLWFLKLAEDVSTKEYIETGMITAKQLDNWFSWREREGYLFYLEE